jgi:hypothetical protein
VLIPRPYGRLRRRSASGRRREGVHPDERQVRSSLQADVVVLGMVEVADAIPQVGCCGRRNRSRTIGAASAGKIVASKAPLDEVEAGSPRQPVGAVAAECSAGLARHKPRRHFLAPGLLPSLPRRSPGWYDRKQLTVGTPASVARMLVIHSASELARAYLCRPVSIPIRNASLDHSSSSSWSGTRAAHRWGWARSPWPMNCSTRRSTGWRRAALWPGGGFEAGREAINLSSGEIEGREGPGGPRGDDPYPLALCSAPVPHGHGLPHLGRVAGDPVSSARGCGGQ